MSHHCIVKEPVHKAAVVRCAIRNPVCISSQEVEGLAIQLELVAIPDDEG